MINFRFHLASLIAVFLALAVGIVMGSTVIDHAIVDGLRTRINTVERDVDTKKAQNDQLRDQLDHSLGAFDSGSPWAVRGLLRNVPVVVFVARGVDSAAAQKTVAMIESAGALTTGFYWMEPTWSLPDDASKTRLETATGVHAGSIASMRSGAWKVVAQQMAAESVAVSIGNTTTTGGAAVTTTTAATPGGVAALTELTSLGFFSFERVGNNGLTGEASNRAVRVLFIGATKTMTDLQDLIVTGAQATTNANLLTEAGEDFQAFTNGPDQGTTLTKLLSDSTLAVEISTVDNLNESPGQVVSALALFDLAQGTVGHYGYGAGATKSFPAPPPS
jgi:hypothetical protein